jgi:hypothetical protein
MIICQLDKPNGCAGFSFKKVYTHCTVSLRLRPKKIPVVPVSYREKIRVGRSEINFFKNIFSWFFQ